MGEVDISAVFQLLGNMAAVQREQGQKINELVGVVNELTASQKQLATDLREHGLKLNELVGVVNDHGRKLDVLYAETQDIRRELATKADKADVAFLRQTVTEYHSSVMGHGILISELDERVRRLERHVGVAPLHL
ncbi:MAG: hypothetical protein H7840_07675 [Alphaproteobacteria bacterium]